MELEKPIQIEGAKDEFTMYATHEGSMEILVGNEIDEISVIRLENVFFDPGLALHILSEDRLTRKGLEVNIKERFL